MRTIHKYELEPTSEVATYEGARFLYVDAQHGSVVVWAEVNTLERECVRRLVVVPTGGEVPPESTYLGTAAGVDGWMVFHVYEQSNSPGQTGGDA